MFQAFRCTLRPAPKQFTFTPINNQVRSFWEYVNMMFNKPDSERIKQFGPDRACAEWVLRNGGKVVWTDGSGLADYNSLPPEGIPVKKIREIDGTDSSISHYGFPHLIGCSMIDSIILHNASYIDDRALKGLYYAQETLKHLQISRCVNVTDEGLKALIKLDKLGTVMLFDLTSVSNVQECKVFLQQHLPNCKVVDKE